MNGGGMAGMAGVRGGLGLGIVFGVAWVVWNIGRFVILLLGRNVLTIIDYLCTNFHIVILYIVKL
jgi:hypothetical protein